VNRIPSRGERKDLKIFRPADMPGSGNRRFWQSAVQAARIFGFIRRRDKAYASPQVSEYQGFAVLGECCSSGFSSRVRQKLCKRE